MGETDRQVHIQEVRQKETKIIDIQKGEGVIIRGQAKH
jgi:hypothetical protein